VGLPYDQVWGEHWKEQVACKKSDPDKSSLCEESGVTLDICIDLIFGFKVRDNIFSSRYLLSVGKRAPYVVLECRGCRSGFGKIDSLGRFYFHGFLRSLGGEWLEEVCDGEDEGSALWLVREGL
jgi:hypothetical protein